VAFDCVELGLRDRAAVDQLHRLVDLRRCAATSSMWVGGMRAA
jgi:hypothetical protein